MARGAVDRTKLDDVAERLGSRLVAAVPVGWGDARSTYRLSLADGRQIAVRAFVGPEIRTRIDQIGRLMTDLARAGLPVPPPTIVETARGPWLATPWVEGETGASWLGDPDRARHLADRMGRLVARLRAVGPVAIGLSGHAPADEPAVDPLERVAFVHGDFAPVNVVMDEGGEIAALLDFEHARAGPALLDVAWWGWVVRHHHPVAWSASWPTFLRAAGLDSGPVEARLHDLVLGTLAERAADSDDPEVRRRWLDRLTEARRWKVQGG